MAGAETIAVQVVYALPSRQRVVALQIPDGSTAADAVGQSGLLLELPEIALESTKLGVFGRRVPSDYVLSEGDRVEIYRPLTADPKTVRRERAQRAKARVNSTGS